MNTLTIRDLTAAHVGQAVQLSLRGGEVVHTGVLHYVTHYPEDTYVSIVYASGAKWSTSDLRWDERRAFTSDTPIQILDEEEA